MHSLTVVYWRDIPAQVLVQSGRRRERRQLAERFEQAIDRAAMRSGARDSDAYLAEWRKSSPVEIDDGNAGELAEREAVRIEAEYGPDRLRALALNSGREP